jgi:hypothetical protein
MEFFSLYFLFVNSDYKRRDTVMCLDSPRDLILLLIVVVVVVVVVDNFVVFIDANLHSTVDSLSFSKKKKKIR